MANCGKCQEKTDMNIRIGGSQMPLCGTCQEAWDRARVKAFEVFVGNKLPEIRRAEPAQRILINCYEGPILKK